MKNMILLIGILISLVGCKQEEQILQEETTIFGTWQLTEQFIVNGVSGSWQSINDGYQYKILSNKSFESNQFNDCSTGVISILSDSISFEYSCNGFTAGIESPQGTFTYLFSINQEILSLHPTFLQCVEGCGYRFKKIAESKEQSGG